MRRTIVLVLIAALAAACAKKHAPASAKSPAPDLQESPKATGAADEADKDSASPPPDPCEGGETTKPKP